MLTENVALAVGLSRAQAGLRKHLEAALGGQHRLGFTDFQILVELASVQGGRLRATDLAKRLPVTPGAITRAVLPLESSGLLSREADPRDARAVYIVLTKAGRERAEPAMETVDRAVAQAFSGALTRADRLALLSAFERLSH